MDLAGPPPPSPHPPSAASWQGREVAPGGQGAVAGDATFQSAYAPVLAPRSRKFQQYLYPDLFVVHLVSQQGELKVTHGDDVPLLSQLPANLEIAKVDEQANTKLPKYSP